MTESGGRGTLRPRAGRPSFAAVEGCLVDVVLPGDPGDTIRWLDQSPSVSLALEDPNPAYDPVDRLWHLRFRAQRRGTVILRLLRERPGRRPMKVSVTLRIGPEHPGSV
ncbi:MAG TPA: hypothetical protein VG455_00365 [Acidimicrobiales bacterium]|nr:hypothetical protein [Acidimicrobiales bacterium]